MLVVQRHPTSQQKRNNSALYPFPRSQECYSTSVRQIKVNFNLSYLFFVYDFVIFLSCLLLASTWSLPLPIIKTEDTQDLKRERASQINVCVLYSVNKDEDQVLGLQTPRAWGLKDITPRLFHFYTNSLTLKPPSAMLQDSTVSSDRRDEATGDECVFFTVDRKRESDEVDGERTVSVTTSTPRVKDGEEVRGFWWVFPQGTVFLRGPSSLDRRVSSPSVRKVVRGSKVCIKHGCESVRDFYVSNTIKKDLCSNIKLFTFSVNLSFFSRSPYVSIFTT